MAEAEWFGRKLRGLREQAGLTRQQLATRAGLKVGGIRDLEQQVNQPKWQTVVDLSRALSVSCEAFLQEPATAGE